MPRTTNNFDLARVGSVAMSACSACGVETGEILIKSQGVAGAPEYTGPRLVAPEGNYCEFCNVAGMWKAQEGIEGRVGAAKVVMLKRDSFELVTYIPFTEEDDRNKTLADGTTFEIRHGTIILAEKDGKGMKLVKVMEPGR